MATIDRYYFTVCTRGAARTGIDTSALLRESGIDPADLDRPGWRGDAVAMARLVRAIWRESGDEAMGFTRHGLPMGTFAFAFELARGEATIREGLTRALRLCNLASRDIETRLSDEEGGTVLTVDFREPALDPDHYFTEFWLIIWHRLACWLSGETVPLVAASFDYARPAYFEEFRHLFPCRHHFDAGRCSLMMDSRALAAPVRRTPAELRAMLALAPLDIMTIPASDHSLARRVRALLARNLALKAEHLADALGIPSETLRKRLRKEGSSLSAQREEARRDAAARALVQGNRSVESIASDLGYSETRSFTRAFRAWTGMSPSQYRHRQGR